MLGAYYTPPAILSKTVTCTLPAVLVLLLWWKKRKKSKLKRDALMLLPMFAIAIVFAKITSSMEGSNVRRGLGRSLIFRSPIAY